MRTSTGSASRSAIFSDPSFASGVSSNFATSGVAIRWAYCEIAGGRNSVSNGDWVLAEQSHKHTRREFNVVVNIMDKLFIILNSFFNPRLLVGGIITKSFTFSL